MRAIPLKRLSALAVGAVISATCATSALAQTIFFEDFGSEPRRVSSPYVPSAGVDSGLGSNAFYQFSPANGIPDGTYAIMPPSQMSATGTDSYWDFTAKDHTTGTVDGAMMVLNAGDKFNQFYRRSFEVQAGKSYRISVWRYVVNGNMGTTPHGPVYWDLEVQQVNSETLLGKSGNIGNTVKNQWEQSTWEFIVPQTCNTPQGNALQATMALRNRSPITGGNDIYIDDISVEEIPNATAPINCPTERVYVVEADDDQAYAPHNTSVLVPVLANDELTSGSGAPGNALLNSSLRVETQPANGTVLVHSDGTVTYTPRENFSGTDQFTYRICNNAPNPACDTATVTVNTSAGVIAAGNDSATVMRSNTLQTAVNVLAGDTLAGNAATLSNVDVSLVDNPANSSALSLDPATGNVSVAANTPAGIYTLEYQICEKLVPENCDTAVATVHVSAGAIEAANDTETVTSSPAAQSAGNVLDGDTLNGATATTDDVSITVVNNPSNSTALSLNTSTGQVTVAAGTPAGIYSLEYRICETNAPTNCDTATTTVHVSAGAIAASNDSATVTTGPNPQAAVNVLDGDTLNGSAVTASTVSISAVGSQNSPELSLNTSTGQVTVAANTPAGEYTLQYQICERNAPSNCDTATATVNVSAGPIVAVDDSLTVPTGSTVTSAGNVLEGDTLAGSAVNLDDVVITLVDNGDNSPELFLNTATGEVTVAANTPPGEYTLDYQICERHAPSNCDTATVTVNVSAGDIVAADDTETLISSPDAQPAGNVLDGDTLAGDAANVTKVTISVTTNTGNSSALSLDTATGELTLVAGTPAGIHTLEYRICEIDAPSNCDTAVATVYVSAGEIAAAADTATLTTSASAQQAVNVLTEDTLNGAPATVDTVSIRVVDNQSNSPQLSLNTATGQVSVEAATPAGIYTLEYEICEINAPSNCATATATVNISAGDIAAVDDQQTVTFSETEQAAGNVLTGDTLDGSTVTADDVLISETGSNNSPALALNTSTGVVTVAANTPPGEYTLDYQICERNAPSKCDTAKITVNVSEGPIVAVNDTDTVTQSPDAQPAGNVLGGDTLNGIAATVGKVSIHLVDNPSNSPALILDEATGAVSVVGGTAAGTYTVLYQICEINAPSQCASATATVHVSAGAIVAADDSETVTASEQVQAVGNVLAGDSLNGTAVGIDDVIIRLADNPSNSTVLVLDPSTGEVSVAANTPAGTYTLEYQICEADAPSNCDTAIYTVNVSAGALQPTTVTRSVSFNEADQHPDGIQAEFVLAGPEPAAWNELVVTVTKPAEPKQPSGLVPAVDPETGAVVVPGNTPPGIYSIELQVCERAVGEANCTTAVLEVEVKSVIDAVDASAPPIRTGQGGQTENLFSRNVLNGQLVSLDDVVVEVTTPAEPLKPNASVPSLDESTGIVTVPVGTPVGSYTIGYRMCDRADATVCDEAVLTIVVVAEAPTPVPVDHPVGLLLAGLGVVLGASRLRRQRKS